MQTPFRLLKINSVKNQSRLGKTSIYQLMKEGLFPRPIKIGKRAVAWYASDIENWLNTRQIAGNAPLKGENRNCLRGNTASRPESEGNSVTLNSVEGG